MPTKHNRGEKNVQSLNYNRIIIYNQILQKNKIFTSHLKGKTVYGHQLVTVMLICDDVVMPYSISIYDKKIKSKIQMTIELIKSLPSPVNEGYVLCDSWYSCKKIFKLLKKQVSIM